MTDAAPTPSSPATGRRKAWLIVLLVVIGAGVLLLGVVIALTVVSKASGSLDPAQNFTTGLADGRYTINPDAYVRVDDQCSFSGAPFSFGSTPPVVGRVTVVGEGAEECGTFEEDATAVIFTVSGGLAHIVDVER